MPRAIQLFALVCVLSLGLVGCTRSSSEPAPGAPEVGALVCRFPQRDCLACNGAHICSVQCPACPPSATSAAGDETASAATTLTCEAPLHACSNCRGGTFCAQHCPVCQPPAPAAAPASLAELTPTVETCGPVICSPGLHCCNPTCALCTPKGVSCTQQTCN